MAAETIKRVEKTVPVKVSRRLFDSVWGACLEPRTTPPKKFGPLLESWVAKLFKAALKSGANGKIAEVVSGESPGRDTTLRLPRSQVKRLGVVSAITGRSVSEMLEEKLWDLLSTK